MTKSLVSNKGTLGIVCLGLIALASCTFSVSPVYNAEKERSPETKTTPAEMKNRDDLKGKGIAQVKALHRLMGAGKIEEAYQMIDDKSPLKLPKDQALANIQEVVDNLGRVEKMELTRDSVVEDKSFPSAQLQVRQEFIVNFEKDTPSPKR